MVFRVNSLEERVDSDIKEESKYKGNVLSMKTL